MTAIDLKRDITRSADETDDGEDTAAGPVAPTAGTITGDIPVVHVDAAGRAETTQPLPRPPNTPAPPRTDVVVEVRAPQTQNRGVRADVQPGRRLGRYRLDAVIGTGASSTVFRAHDLSLDLPVVVKVLADDASDAAVDRFRKEILFSRRVANPGFSRIFELHEDETFDGPLRYLTMELVDGRTLGDLMNDGPMPPLRALTIARDLCAIVTAAHDQGVVHGDLKPSNVMLRAGPRRNVTDRWQEPKDDLVILDFGAATAKDVKDPGVRVGSVRYMAPELFELDAAAHRPSPQTDVWAIGVIAYACLTGRYPFDGGSDRDVADASRRTDAAPPSKHRDGLSDAVDDAVLKALARDRAARHVDCRAFKAALNEAIKSVKTKPGLFARLRRLFR